MEQSSFQDYYKEVRDRDQAIAEATPLPEARGASVWTIFGLAFGITAMVMSWLYPLFGIVIGAIAAGCAVMGYMKKKDNLGMAAVICSALGLIMSIGFYIGYMF